MSGTHLALERDDAKQLFGRRDPEALQDWLVNDALQRIVGEHRLELSDWRLIHRLLGDGSLTRDAGEYPLNQCFLGGRPLDAGDQWQVCVIRPDIVVHLADALANFPFEMVSDKLQALPQDFAGPRDASVADDATAQLQRLRDFFQAATQLRAAVIFCCDAD